MTERAWEESDGEGGPCVHTLQRRLEEERDHVRILQSNLRTADQRHQMDNLLHHAEQLLRKGAERERDETREIYRRLYAQNHQLRRELDERRPWLRWKRRMGKANDDVKAFFRGKLGQWLRELCIESFPEYDLGSDSSLPQMIVSALHDLRTATEALGKRKHWQTVTLAVLVPPGHPEVPLSFCSRSVTLEVPDDRSQRGTHLLETRFDWDLPEGTWIVAIGGTISEGMVGNRLLGASPDGSFARLEERAIAGTTLKATLLPA